MNEGIGVVIAAAGSSSRLGFSKQLLKLNGKSLLERACQVAYNCVCKNTIVVLGSNAPAHRASIASLPVNIVVNDHWERGIGSSIKLGLSHLINASPSISALIVMVCDQPFVNETHIRQLIQTYEEVHPLVVASAYGSTVGVPVLFDKQLFVELSQIKDEEGAKRVITRHTDNLRTVHFPLAEIDIDTPDDLKNLHLPNP
jgi:molybdenum cofactor cytidylyltransferase